MVVHTHRLAITVAGIALLLIGVLNCENACGDGKPTLARVWEKMPYGPGRSTAITCLGIDEHGTLWMMGGTGVYFWDGSQFKQMRAGELRAGAYLTQLYGGRDRGLYVSQYGAEGEPGKLFVLRDQGAESVDDFRFEKTHFPAGLYVSKTGQLFNWTSEFLAVRSVDGWKRFDVTVANLSSLNRAMIFDAGQDVHFFFKDRLFTIDKKHELTEREIKLSTRRPITSGVMWGGDRAVLFEQYSEGPHLLDLQSGEILDNSDLRRQLTSSSTPYGFAGKDGSVDLFCRDDGPGQYRLFRLGLDGKAKRTALVLSIDEMRIRERSARASLCTSDGTQWFACKSGIVAITPDQKIHRFGRETGLNLGGCHSIVEGKNGEVFAASHSSTYVFRRGTNPLSERRQKDRSPTVLKEFAWKHDYGKQASVRSSWLVGDAVSYFDARKKTLNVLDAETGKQRFALPVSDGFTNGPILAPGRMRSELLVSTPKLLRTLDNKSGQVQSKIEYPFDGRIMPISYENDFLAVRGGRGRVITRIDSQGQEQWECALPGYVQHQPAQFGETLIVQTRQASYGGQATSGIDINTGERLWSEVVNAYGCGVDFGDNGDFMVEADSFLSPPRTEAWLIGRKPRTGERLWHFRREGGSSHRPVVQRETGRVFALVGRGEVVCLNGSDGEVIWETQLPENAHPRTAASYDPYWSAIALFSDRLAALDRNRVVHLIDANSGDSLARVNVTSAFEDDSWNHPAQILTTPRLTGTKLIVATTRGVAAFQLRAIISKEARPKDERP